MDSQLAYQSAFLQNAVAQNMQIQQQLMLQNQVNNKIFCFICRGVSASCSRLG
jgi:hypothetical protein